MPKKTKTAAQLEREIAQALTQFSDPDIERMFKKGGSDHDRMVLAVLGDPMYAKRFKMPKWNIKPTVLDTPDVAIKHWNELGIPRSKNAHAQRADYFRDLRSRFQAEHKRLLSEGDRLYGANGPVISGGFHEDWPKDLKDRIRFAAHGSTLLGDAVRLHEALSKSRSPVFQ